jgi:hypothetical protein
MRYSKDTIRHNVQRLHDVLAEMSCPTVYYETIERKTDRNGNSRYKARFFVVINGEIIDASFRVAVIAELRNDDAGNVLCGTNSPWSVLDLVDRAIFGECNGLCNQPINTLWL